MQKNNGNQLRFDSLTRLTRSQSNATVEKNSPLIVIVESITFVDVAFLYQNG